MVRKKQFINKKTAQHFHVVHRSQRDPKANDPEASKYVLLSSKAQVEIAFDSEEDEDGDDDYEDDDEEDEESDDDMPDLVDSPRSGTDAPAPPASYEAALKAAKKSAKPKAKKPTFATRKVRFGGVVAEDLVDENGMVRDGYDYSQHMKEMGKGRFYSANGQFASQMDLARRVELPEDVLPSAEEQDRLLDAITLTTETMDSDLHEALINDKAFEELDDDFMMQAAAEDPDEAADDGFDYDAHIAKLMAAASGVGAPKVKGNLTDSEDDDDDDSEYDDDDEEEEDRELSALEKSEQQRALDEAFERMMAEEYDEDQLGELDEEDPETRGDVVLEGELLASIVDDFVQVRQEMLNDEGKIGNPLRTGNRLKEILEECERERAEEGETEDEEPISPEEEAETDRQLLELFQRNAYLAPREEEQWDCETIVSTYSNLDNHPTLLREDGALKKKKKKKPTLAALDEEALALAARNKSQILLSRKTGMPLGVFETTPTNKKEKPTTESANPDANTNTNTSVVKNKRDESREDKKARKEAAKLEKQQRRQEKKQWKTAFKEEEQRQLAQTKPGKVSVFKY